jgi:hypothetical protein
VVADQVRGGSDILNQLRVWFEERSPVFARSGYHAEFSESPSDRGKLSASVTVASSRRIGQLVIWDSGEADLSMGDVGSATVVQEHREITSQIGLRDATETLVTWLDEIK